MECSRRKGLVVCPSSIGYHVYKRYAIGSPRGHLGVICLVSGALYTRA